MNNLRAANVSQLTRTTASKVTTVNKDLAFADLPLTRILLIDSNAADVSLISDVLRQAEDIHCHLQSFSKFDAALAHLSATAVDVILLDLSPSDCDGTSMLAAINRSAPSLPIIALTDLNNEKIGLRAMQEGAQDYLVKTQLDSRLLSRAIRYAIERKRSQEKLHHAAADLEHNNRELHDVLEKVSRLEQLKTDMIRVASHDLGGMVGIILGYCDLIHLEVWDNLSDEHQKWIADIESTATRMQNLTQDILSLERIEAGTTLTQIDLRGLVSETFDEYWGQAQHKGLKMALSMNDDRLLIEGDTAQLREAVTNLIANAIKYTPQDGTISVSLAADGTQDHMVFEVKDTGFGIPSGLQSQLFQPFFRAHTRETHNIRGTGLGLHLVKNIIERHHGKMRFHSVYGEGSTFGFDLPVLK